MLLKPCMRSLNAYRSGLQGSATYLRITGLRLTNSRGGNLHFCSSSSSKIESSKSSQSSGESINHEIPKEFMPEEVIDKIQSVRSLDVTEKVSLRPVKPLGIKPEVLRVRKNGSFIKQLYIGKFDTDFLAYPEILHTRQEFDNVQRQCEMIETYFRNFSSNQKALHELNFDKLWKMTVTEMMTVFESIGKAIAIKIDDCNKIKTLDQTGQDELKGELTVDQNAHPLFNNKNVHALFDLLNHNCLGFGAVEWCDSDTLRDRIIELLRKDPSLKIGFAWTERELPFGAGSFADWESTASRTADGRSWLINGSKNRILKDNYDFYAIFCKTTDYTDDERPQWLLTDDAITPPGIVSFLVPASKIGKIEDEEVVNGLIYQRIVFDHMILPEEEYLLIEPSPLGVRSLNIRGLGYLGTSATILGMLKALLADCYKYLSKYRTPLLECQTIERILCDITGKIYILESCIYLTSQAYDAFDYIDADPEQNLEASICKVLAIDTGHKVLEMIQSIYGSQMLITSPIHDFLHALDSYLDNTVHHRVNIGTSGMWFAGYYKNTKIRKLRLAPFFPVYKLYDLINDYKLGKDRPKLLYNFKGHVHPSLADEADLLETLTIKFGLAVEVILHRWAKKAPRRQNDLERLAEMTIDIFATTCTLSRASKAYCDACKNCDLDRLIAISVTKELYEKGMLAFEELNNSDQDTNEYRNHDIHRKNIEYGGYFAQSALNKIHY